MGCEIWECGKVGMWEMPIRALTGVCVSSSDWSRRTRAKRYMLLIIIITIGTSLFIES